MNIVYFEDWTAIELRAERKAIEAQLLTGAARVSYSGAGAGSVDYISQIEAKSLIRLISLRIAELEGTKPKKSGMRFIQLIPGGL